MSIVKYLTSKFGRDPIEAVEVERETESSVWVVDTWRGERGNTRRHAKRSDWDNYFDTWEEAKAFLMAQAEAKVTAARRALDSANGELGNVKGLKPPSAQSGLLVEKAG